jgi:hypothetical protein
VGDLAGWQKSEQPPMRLYAAGHMNRLILAGGEIRRGG